MKSLKGKNLIIQFVDTKANKKKTKLFLHKFVFNLSYFKRNFSLVLITLPYIYNLNKKLQVSISSYTINYFYILRYLYCFGLNSIKY